MTNNKIKNLIRKSMFNSRGCIDIGRIRFKGVNRKEDGSMEINKTIMTLNSIDSVLVDELKSVLHDIEMEHNISFISVYLDIQNINYKGGNEIGYDESFLRLNKRDMKYFVENIEKYRKAFNDYL